MPSTRPCGSRRCEHLSQTECRMRSTLIARSSRHQKTFFSVLGTVILFVVSVPDAGGQDRFGGSRPLQRGLVKLPVVDKQDIRFTRVSVNNVPIQPSTSGITQDRYGFLWFG